MRDAKRQRTQSPIGSDESASYAGVPVYEILPESDVQKILDATFALMGEIGVAFDPDPRADSRDPHDLRRMLKFFSFRSQEEDKWHRMHPE